MKRAFNRSLALIGMAGVGMALAAGSMAVFGMRAPTPPGVLAPVWNEAKWPFPIDQWGIGRAFVCESADCGAKVEVYVRPKIGFCNCSTGVSDDKELERVADTDLLRPDVQPLGPGRPVKVGWMEGLRRTYRATDARAGHLMSVAFNDECDVVVAVASLGPGDPALVEPAVMDFLRSRPMVLWAKRELGLEFVAREW
jgi:hypothetical protein